MSNYVRRAAGTSLSEKELQQLRDLAQMPDSDIDCSDIPEKRKLKQKTRERGPSSRSPLRSSVSKAS
jgi:hypothetical protein